MMNSIHIALLCLAPVAQDAPRPKGRTVPTSELVMEVFVPKHLDSGELQRLASDLAGSKYQATDPELGERSMRSLRRFNDAVLIYDTVERAKTLLELLSKLDGIAAAEESRRRALQQADDLSDQHAFDGIVPRQYRPRFLSLEDVGQATLPYRLRYEDRFEFVEDAGFMVFTLPDPLAQEVVGFLERIDVPMPQLEITAYLVRGMGTPASSPAPEELAQGLRKLMGLEHIQIEASSMLRTSAAAGGLSLRLDVDGPMFYELQLSPAAFAEKEGALSLEKCTLFRGDTISDIDDLTRIFGTETIIYCGEYTVLGATGASPELVVIRCERAGGARTPSKAGKATMR